MPAQPACFHRLDEKRLHPAGRRTGVELRHLPLAFAGPGWFRHKPCPRTVLSPGGVCHSLLLQKFSQGAVSAGAPFSPLNQRL